MATILPHPSQPFPPELLTNGAGDDPLLLRPVLVGNVVIIGTWKVNLADIVATALYKI